MAGVGKTTLVIEAAYRCLLDCDFKLIIFSSAQSQQFVGTHLTRRFIAERNLKDLLQAIFRTLERQDNIPIGIEEQILSLQELLAQQPTLLVVDNIENVADQSDTIGFLACLPPTVKVIIASRVRLGLEGEAIALKPLTAEESTHLIKHQANKQNLAIKAEQINQIQRTAKGLPLAIAYLVGYFSINEEIVPKEPIADSELALYCFERAISQLRTIPNAYQLLLSLSLFPDGGSFNAISHLIDTLNKDAIASSLQELHRRTLTFSLAPERYGLHSLTQEYVLKELNQQPQLAQTLRDRWLNWYLDFAAPYNAVYWQEWQEDGLLSIEWENLRSVVDWCIQQQDYESVLHFWQCLKGFTLHNGYWQDRQEWLSWLESAAQEREDLAIVAELKYHNSYTLAFIDESDASGKAICLALEAWKMQEHLKVEVQFDLAMYIAALYIRQRPQASDRAATLELYQFPKILLQLM
jgi:LuxR family glucitol operon transcriptional activator